MEMSVEDSRLDRRVYLAKPRRSVTLKHDKKYGDTGMEKGVPYYTAH